MYDFNLTAILTQELAKGGSGVTLSELNWPTSIQNGIDGLRSKMDAAFVLYCISIALSILVMFSSIVGLLTWGNIRVVRCNIWLSFVSTNPFSNPSGRIEKGGSRLTCSLDCLYISRNCLRSCHQLRFQSNQSHQRRRAQHWSHCCSRIRIPRNDVVGYCHHATLLSCLGR
jgi:hypothetical protein